MKRIFPCAASCLLLVFTCAAQDASGTWQTSVQSLGRNVNYVIHISQREGTVAAVLDIPERLEFGSSVDSVDLKNGIFQFETGPAKYEGRIAPDGQTITGTW